MTFTTTILLPLLAVSLFFYSSSASVTIIAENDMLIDAICQQTMNSGFCKSTLCSDPSTQDADMKEIAVTTILSAVAQATVNKYIVNDMLHKEKDLVTKIHLAACLVDYMVTLGKLRDAYRMIDTKYYRKTTRLVKEGMRMSTKCEGRFKEPTKVPLIAKYSQKLDWFNDIALVALHKLDG